jgi:hypothetical protein
MDSSSIMRSSKGVYCRRHMGEQSARVVGRAESGSAQLGYDEAAPPTDSLAIPSF